MQTGKFFLLKLFKLQFKLTHIFCLILLILTHVIYGQQDVPTKGLSISYYNSMLVHPGLRVGYEFPIWQKEIEKSKHKTKLRTLIVKSNLGFYSHSRNNTGLFLNSHLGYRFTSNTGLYTEPLHIGLGYLQTFLGGKTYTVDQSGIVSEIKLANNSNLILPYISVIGLGYDFRKQHKTPLNIFFSFDAFVQRTVNTKTILRLSVPIGITYYFK